MGKLRERLDQFHAAQVRITREVEIAERYTRAAPKLEYMYSLIEGEHPARQRKYAERQSIKACLTLWEDIAEEMYGEEVDLVDDMLESYDRLKLTTEDAAPVMSMNEVRDRQYRDVVENFLYMEWLEQEDGIGSFSHFCTFVSLKAFVNLVTMHQDSLKALLELGIFIPDDLRNRCMLFKEREDYDPNHPTWYVPNLLMDVPEAWYVSQDLLIHYSEQARLENVETPLPDNPFLDTTDSERARVRQAINAYLAREGSVKSIAKKYGLSRRQLDDELRLAGVLRGHGGDRK